MMLGHNLTGFQSLSGLLAGVLGSSRGHNLPWRQVTLQRRPGLAAGRRHLSQSVSKVPPTPAAICQMSLGKVLLTAKASNSAGKVVPCAFMARALPPETPAVQFPPAAAVRHPAAVHKRQPSGAAESACGAPASTQRAVRAGPAPLGLLGLQGCHCVCLMPAVELEGALPSKPQR